MGIAGFALALLLYRAVRIDPARRAWARPWLVSAQVAVALVLILAAITPVRALIETWTVDVGFDASRLQVIDVAVANLTYDERRETVTRIADRLAELPGAEAVRRTLSVTFVMKAFV